MVARRGSTGDAGSSRNVQYPHPLATIKAHATSTQPLSPLQNPEKHHNQCVGVDVGGGVDFGVGVGVVPCPFSLACSS
jgi:hypothetical protein